MDAYDIGQCEEAITTMRRTWIGIGLTSVVALCMIGLSFGAYRVATQPRTYSEAIIQALDQRGMVHRDVRVGRFCGPGEHCLGFYGPADNYSTLYVADVVVERSQPVYGRVTCARLREECVIIFPGRQSEPIPLPELAPEVPGLVRIWRGIEAIAAWLSNEHILQHP
jgi:hypothetical protein